MPRSGTISFQWRVIFLGAEIRIAGVYAATVAGDADEL
jgi:hypothetical protein